MRSTLSIRTGLLLLFLSLTAAWGQITSISGMVRDARTQEPLPFANIVIMGTRLGATTNIDGYFFLGDMQLDSLDLVCSYIGYQTYHTRLYFHQESHEEVRIYLRPKTIGLREVVVEDSLLLQPEYQPDMKQASPEADSLITLIPDTLPVIVGYTVNLNPPRKWLRITNDHIQYQLDGVPVYNTRHLYSIFQPFNLAAAKYIRHYVLGGAASQGFTHDNFSNLVFNEGNRSGFQAIGKLGMLESNLTTSGPHPLGGSWYVSGRRIDFDSIYSRKYFPTSNLFAPSTPDYYFYELNGKATFDISDKTTAAISFLTSHDKLHWYGAADSIYAQSIWDDGFWMARIQHRLSNQFLMHASLYRTRYYGYMRGTLVPLWGNQQFSSAMANELITYGGFVEGEYYTGQNNFLTAGVHSQILSPRMNFADASRASSGLSALVATYASYRYSLPWHLVLDGGLRAMLNTGLSQMYWDPRLEVIWQPNNVYALNARIGHYSTMIAELSLPTTIEQPLMDVILPYDKTLPVPQTWLMGLGGKWTPRVGYDLQGRIYYATESSPATLDSLWTGRVDVLGHWLQGLQSGRRIGLDVVAERRLGDLTSLIHYQLGQAVWTDSTGFEFKAPGHRTQRLSISIGGNLNAHTGYTAAYRLASGKAYLDAVQNEKVGGFYNRLDVSLYRDFTWKSISGRVTLAIYNLTNASTRALPVSARSLTAQEDRGYALLPFLPTVNFSFQF